MDFDFTEDQYALRDLARDVFAKESPPARLREVWEADGERDPRVWKTLADVGLLGLTAPEDHGGLGGNATDLALVLEEAGRAALPEPFLETVAIAAPMLVRFGSDEQRAEWLPRIAAGDAIATVRPPGSPFAVDADIASFIILDEGGDTRMVFGDGLAGRRVPSEDRARRLFHYGGGAAGDPLPPGATASLARLGAVATASLLNGVSLRLLETTVEYVKGREQFGRPVGSFQAVKHKLATVHTELEAARSSAWYAAYAISYDLPGADRAAGVAKAAANEAGALANREALQLHAGIGFTWEHDLHLWLKRGKALEGTWGTAREHRARLAAGLFEDEEGAP
jgi:alkylation response protein AidB-like acyl-CoA dehydrogenase